MAALVKVNGHMTSMLAYFLEKMQASPEGDGSMLDHMTILYGAGISNSTSHQGTNLPLLVLGGGAGTIKGGRHLRFSADTSNADLLMTLMDKLDMPLDRLGDSTTRLPIDTLSEVWSRCRR